ncbi:FAD binding domain-containing protein [Pseudonocardia sp.]|uniref:FAD binding domain-containing protein n=1 Tax=Pseudonocardia sp. TaxID=60912 RepID=UPI003D13A645
MKPAPFAYVRPGTLDGVLAELAGEDAKVLAGGQSLVPVLAMRLGAPATLVDVTAVPELHELAAGVADGGGGRRVLRIGAAVRQRAVERSAVAREVPLLGMALPFVGHRELRSRGTVCGSLAHADPAAELPAVAACLDAVLEIAGPSGRRRVPADGFFAGFMTTALAEDEVLVAVELPVAGPGEGFGFAEIARRHGDFALAGVATRVRVDSAGAVTGARLAAFGVSDRPLTCDVTALVADGPGGADGADGTDERALREVLGDVVAGMVDTAGDGHASAGYRRRLLRVLAARELAAARRRAAGAGEAGGVGLGPGGGGPGRGGRGADASGGPGPERGPRDRVDAAAVAEVTLTVNGAPVTVTVPPRQHLADTLRDRVRLTGTHLGCEHGVCGMCTVLVDGVAARACLLFTVQCDGAEIVTVEGLGTPDAQHPLQEAFSAHHALQCGFCTPGMLMSAYGLLCDDPAPEQLARDMSGVLCRCTGYRGVLAAVADVAQAHPGGIPTAPGAVPDG